MDVDGVLDDVFLWFVKKIMEAALGLFQLLMSWWIGKSFNVNFADEQGAGGVLNFLRLHTNWLTALMAFAGFLFAAFRTAVQRKGEPLRAAFSQFFELAVIVLMLASVVHLAGIAGDRYSNWILTVSAPDDGNWAKSWTSQLDIFQGTATMVLFAFFGAFASLSLAIQFALMLFRSAVMVVLVGILPVFAASRFSSYGDYAYKRALGWLISWWAYGPIAATGAAAGQKLLTSKYQMDQLSGMALLIGMVFALPAIFSAIMPAVREDNNFIGPRQLGHFMFGSTAVNAGKGTGFWSGWTNHANQRRGALGVPANASTRPWRGGPGGGNPGTPGSGTPGSGTPGSGTPGSGTPGSGTPGGGTPGTPGSGTPGRGIPGSGTPGSGTPGSGTPGSGTPGSGTPGSGARGGATVSGATPSGAPAPGATSGATSGGTSSRSPGGVPPGGSYGGAGGLQADGASGANAASGSFGYSVPALPQDPGLPAVPKSSPVPEPHPYAEFFRNALDDAGGPSGSGGHGGGSGPSGSGRV